MHRGRPYVEQCDRSWLNARGIATPNGGQCAAGNLQGHDHEIEGRERPACVAEVIGQHYC
jgi:hypothetical protein